MDRPNQESPYKGLGSSCQVWEGLTGGIFSVTGFEGGSRTGVMKLEK